MIFMVMAQIIVLLLNLAILIITKITDQFHEFIYIVPVIGYSVMMTLFYISYYKTTRKAQRWFSNIAIVVSAILINLVFAFVETFIENPELPIMFYICISIVQVINLIFLFTYTQTYAGKVMDASQQVVHRIISYIFVVLAFLTLYCCFASSTYVVAFLLMMASFFAAVATTMFLIAARSRNY